MTAPPGITPAPAPGGTTTGRYALTGNQLEAMTRAAHAALVECDVVVGPSKVARLVRRFSSAIAKTGVTFHEFLSGEVRLTSEQRHRLLRNPDWSRAIAYCDPTGETAVNNVMRGV